MIDYVKIYECRECVCFKMYVGNYYCRAKYENGKRKIIENPENIPEWCPKKVDKLLGEMEIIR
ncbi:MAG: hypothetical protein WC898_04030 [Candidatus Paceibacterota bacterium]|jgi:hypothetical protein